MQEMMETIAHLVAPDPEPDPEGGPGGRRIEARAPDRRISIEEKAMRHGRKSSAKPATAFRSTLPWMWIAKSRGRGSPSSE